MSRVFLETHAHVYLVWGCSEKMGEDFWLSERLEAKIPRDLLPFLFSSYRKGHIKLGNQKALSRKQRKES